jgi:hypothetical protein
MLYEDDVVQAVARHLTASGWKVESTALATEHGDDLVASKAGRRLIVEAKGEGSSKAGTSRYGQPFTGNQAKTHVAVAVLRALTVTSAGTAQAGLAFPDNAHHNDLIKKVAPALERESVVVFLVAEDGSVRASLPV